MAEDIEAQLLERKSTDVDKATMIVFVRYIFQEDAHEDMLCAFLLPTVFFFNQ